MTPDSSSPHGADYLPGPIARVDRLLVPIENAANFVAAFFIFLLMVLGVAQIVLRSVFDYPLLGYIDMVELSMAGMAFLGAAYTQRMGAHIRMELIVGSLRGRALWLAEILGTLVGLVIVGILIKFSWDHFLRAYQIGDTTIDAELPIWPSKLVVPLAFGFWFLRLALQLAGQISLFIDPTRRPEGVIVARDAAETARDAAHEMLDRESGKSASGRKEP
ncbi:TRAP transporter small permease [Paracoccus sp. 1_MG-2023]|uniref:TRAP transporter small permease subunit n=1 Tax=unclassified Paracoccus (in: a-proteobacteria) TaxID=2688777 RepID=UPI001C08D263|nr:MULTISPECIES: TRAP transporter small permease [unclassified Paracoccus (in: a-proteobacteria)]MBU2958976.1 TRAP transporter small permease [Paracoccus sp. C2R09]MDO6670375.1 TRAP transporter small permease [Paracoccus sp. 1_MG-2023]